MTPDTVDKCKYHDEILSALTAVRNQPCNYHTEIVNTIASIKGSIQAIVEIHSNHWNEIKDTLDELKTTVRLVNGHENILKNMKEEKLNTTKNAQYRVGLIVGVIMGLITIVGNIFIKAVLK